ncbi:MAG TPA: diacylglycerol kinase family protein [Limnobacter sp.]|nr:diacylglycerol kinase family protein [Limnobacter sp.]
MIANPNAGYLKRRPQSEGIDHLKRLLAGQGRLLLTQNAHELPAMLQALPPEHISALVPFGGDGTVSAVIGAAAQAWGEANIPPLFLVHAGTMNMIASDIHAKRPPMEALHWLLSNQSALGGLHTMRYPLKTSTGQYGFVFGFGTTVNFMHAYYARGGGPWGAMRLIARIVLEVLLRGPMLGSLFQTVRGQVTFKEKPTESFAWQLALALSILRLPMGAKVSSSGGPQAKADFCLIHGTPNKLALVLNLGRIWRGQWPASLQVPRQTSTHVEFCFAQATAWQLDGDIQVPTHHLCLAVSNGLRFVCRPTH